MKQSVRLFAAAVTLAGCSHPMSSGTAASPTPFGGSGNMTSSAPRPDPRVGLRAGLFDAATANWNLQLVSTTKQSPKFLGSTNSDLAFSGKYAIQGSYNGYQVWDISNPAAPALTTAMFCPASQSDVSVYKNLLFVSSESGTGRVDCGGQGVSDTVSKDRLRGIRVFDATDIAHPKPLTVVQTCRGSHTHTIVTDPNDKENIYVYISGSAGVRSPNELPGCSNLAPDKDANSAHFRIEVIKVPLAHPEKAALVGSARIFDNLAAPPSHGDAAEDLKEIETARKAGAFIAVIGTQQIVLPPQFVTPMLDSVVRARKGTGAPTAADSAAFRAYLPTLVGILTGGASNAKPTGPDQCHDITVYPSIGLAGGACGGYGLLLDIHDPAHPQRIGAAADSNFSYWHSATFNNDGSKILFSDEWGGGGAPKCRATDKPEWGADAIFTLVDRKMTFKGYYKLPAAQTKNENCVAHNGSLIPVPGRDIMVQAWYQGGISVFDWTDPAHAKEIAYFDRGPIDSTKMVSGGSWSAYWYNGVIVSSEIARGLDIFELTPNALLTKNEIDAAKTVRLEQLNVQDQPKYSWPTSFVLARAYIDQLERSKGLSSARIVATRAALATAENGSGATRADALSKLATQLDSDARGSSDRAKVQMLGIAVAELGRLSH